MRKQGGKPETWSMKNFLNSIRKQEEKPIICLQRMKNLWNLVSKRERKTGCWLIEDRDKRFLNQRLEYNIYIWGHKKHYRTFGAMKSITAFSLTPYFLLLLLAPLLGRPCFHFGYCSFGTISLAIGGTESTGRKVAVSFSGCFLWKVLINFQRCITANKGSQVFFFSG